MRIYCGLGNGDLLLPRCCSYLAPLSADYYEQLMARIEDLEDVQLLRERQDGPFVEVALRDL